PLFTNSGFPDDKYRRPAFGGEFYLLHHTPHRRQVAGDLLQAIALIEPFAQGDQRVRQGGGGRAGGEGDAAHFAEHAQPAFAVPERQEVDLPPLARESLTGNQAPNSRRFPLEYFGRRIEHASDYVERPLNSFPPPRNTNYAPSELGADVCQLFPG